MTSNTKKALQQLRALDRLGRTDGLRLAAEGWSAPWKTLIAIIMSARTRDEVTVVVGEKLFKAYPTMKSLAEANLNEVADIIKPVNFYRNKSKSVVSCAQRILRDFGGVVPDNCEALITLPGVGRKTANVFLAEKGDDAIGVDTHVAYISRFLGWTAHVKPEKIEIDLQNLFPKNFWKKINSTCVHFGKKYLSRKTKDQLLADIKHAS